MDLDLSVCSALPPKAIKIHISVYVCAQTSCECIYAVIAIITHCRISVGGQQAKGLCHNSTECHLRQNSSGYNVTQHAGLGKYPERKTKEYPEIN